MITSSPRNAFLDSAALEVDGGVTASKKQDWAV
jgi:hypothetical protein